MEIPPFPEAVARICARDGRYAPEAFIFLNEGLLQTLKQVQEKEKKPRQISGAELAAGLRKHALAQFGPLALTVLNRWGVRTTRDFGEIVMDSIGNSPVEKLGYGMDRVPEIAQSSGDCQPPGVRPQAPRSLGGGRRTPRNVTWVKSRRPICRCRSWRRCGPAVHRRWSAR